MTEVIFILTVRLRELGFPSYEAYLKNSAHWHVFRMTHIAKACWTCGEWRPYRLVLHHIAYERLGEERDDDVVTLCEWCHERCHQLIRSGKAKLFDAHHILRVELRVRGLGVQQDLPFEPKKAA